jgi:hypothetical protein
VRDSVTFFSVSTVMGVDVGFDMVPPLEPESQSRWENFLDSVLQDDPVVKLNQLEIEFEVGEHPCLPRAGYAFRRFSSKVSGSSLAEPYIREVYKIARRHFGAQVELWNEYVDQCGHYGWDEVHAVKKKYLSTADSGSKED